MDSPLQPTDPARSLLRAADADRERVAALLQDSYSQGRLVLEEFQDRLEQAYGAKTLGQLDVLTTDLPSEGTRPAKPAQMPSGQAVGRKNVRDRALCYLIIMLFLVGIWAASGREGSFWPIWPILVGGLILTFDIFGLERPGRHRRRAGVYRHRRRQHHGNKEDESE